MTKPKLSNVISYAFEEGDNEEIEIACEVAADCLKISIKDKGMELPDLAIWQVLKVPVEISRQASPAASFVLETATRSSKIKVPFVGFLSFSKFVP